MRRIKDTDQKKITEANKHLQGQTTSKVNTGDKKQPSHSDRTKNRKKKREGSQGHRDKDHQTQGSQEH